MKNTKEIGDIGENIAEKFLKKRGYRIISRNFKAKGGEIDIIGYRFGVLVYFEVKTRSNEKFGKPAEAVDEIKIARIKTAAKAFLQTYASGNKIPVFYPFGIERRQAIRKQQIHVIEVYLNGNNYKINHIKNFNGV